MELALSHISCAYKSELAARFLEHLWKFGCTEFLLSVCTEPKMCSTEATVRLWCVRHITTK